MRSPSAPPLAALVLLLCGVVNFCAHAVVVPLPSTRFQSPADFAGRLVQGAVQDEHLLLLLSLSAQTADEMHSTKTADDDLAAASLDEAASSHENVATAHALANTNTEQPGGVRSVSFSSRIGNLIWRLFHPWGAAAGERAPESQPAAVLPPSSRSERSRATTGARTQTRSVSVVRSSSGSHSSSQSRRAIDCVTELGLAPDAQSPNEPSKETLLPDVHQIGRIQTVTNSNDAAPFQWEDSGALRKYELLVSKDLLSDPANVRNIFFMTETCSHRSEFSRSAPAFFSVDRTPTQLRWADIDSLKWMAGQDTSGGTGMYAPFAPDQACNDERPFRTFVGWCLTTADKGTLSYVWQTEKSFALKEYVDKAAAKALSMTKDSATKELFETFFGTKYATTTSKEYSQLAMTPYHKEGAMHRIVVSILHGLKFLHEVKGIALLDLDFQKIELSALRHKALLRSFSNACVFTSVSAYPCSPGTLPEAVTNALYEPDTYYGFDALNSNYANWWKADLFLLGTQLVLPMLTNGFVTVDTICPKPQTTPPPSTLSTPTDVPLDQHQFGGAKRTTSLCGPFIDLVFGYFKESRPQDPGCNVAPRTLRWWKYWHGDSSPWALNTKRLREEWEGPEDAPLSIRDNLKRLQAYNSLFVKLAVLHKGAGGPDDPNSMMCAAYDREIRQRTSAPQGTPSQGSAVPQSEAPLLVTSAAPSLLLLLADPRYRFNGLQGSALQEEGFAPCLWRNRRVLACKWVQFLLDLWVCPDIRQPADVLIHRLEDHYTGDMFGCDQFFSDPCEKPSGGVLSDKMKSTSWKQQSAEFNQNQLLSFEKLFVQAEAAMTEKSTSRPTLRMGEPLGQYYPKLSLVKDAIRLKQLLTSGATYPSGSAPTFCSLYPGRVDPQHQTGALRTLLPVTWLAQSDDDARKAYFQSAVEFSQ